MPTEILSVTPWLLSGETGSTGKASHRGHRGTRVRSTILEDPSYRWVSIITPRQSATVKAKFRLSLCIRFASINALSLSYIL
jgi:hypothetical protein